MRTAEKDDIQQIRQDVQAVQKTIQTVLQSILERLDALSPQDDVDALAPQDDVDDTTLVSTLSPEDAAQQKYIIISGDGWDAYGFAVGVTGADIPALQKVVLERGDSDDVYEFAKDVKGADLCILHKRLVELHSAYMDGGYLDKFNHDPDIQSRLKEQLNADGGKKNRPS